MSFFEISREYGEVPKDWIVFAVERSLYHKIISMTNMQLNFKNYQVAGSTMISSVHDLKRQLARIIDNRTTTNVRNVDLYRDKMGKVRAEILRYENLNEDLVRLMSKLRIANYPALQHFKKGMSSNKLCLNDLFSTKQLQLINETFSEEFNCFGYSMIE